MKHYEYIQDPGHGWIKVEKEEIKRLAISDKISNCSYQNGGFAYLEEDSDAGIFLDAKIAKKEEYKIIQKHVESTPIRDYACYQA